MKRFTVGLALIVLGLVIVVDATAGLRRVSAAKHGEERTFIGTVFQRNLYQSDNSDDKCGPGCRISIGIFLILFSPFLIWWNEHAHMRLVKLYKAAQRVVCDLGVAPQHTRSNGSIGWDRNFVCMSGSLEGGTCLSDDIFPLAVRNILLLAREIEIFQYYETSGNKDEKPKLKTGWFKLPRKDPPSFKDNKNPVGNWNVLASTEKHQDTGNTLNGVPITFGDYMKIWRAPHPTLGANGAFEIPEALMNEAFFGMRHIHRLHEVERIRAFQGTWTELHPSEFFNSSWYGLYVDDPLIKGECRHINCRLDGKYVYDGDPLVVGTIRMTWRCVKTQDVTVAAEAVAPRRPCVGSYGTETLDFGGSVKCSKLIDNMVADAFEPADLESQPLLGGKKSQKTFTNESKWTFTPFAVTRKRFLPPYDEQYLGHLWMIDSGVHTSSQLFRKAHKANDACLWKVRGLSYILLFAGWVLLFTTPVEALLGRGIFSYILGMALGLAALVISTSCWVTCTAVACFTARPVRATVAIALVWAIVVHLHERSSRMMGSPER